MGQEQSRPKPKPILLNREPTPEPSDPEEAARLREEKQKRQDEERARRVAAVEQRLANKPGKKTPAAGSSTGNTTKRKETPLEQLSRENKGWRDADVQADLRAWN